MNFETVKFYEFEISFVKSINWNLIFFESSNVNLNLEIQKYE